MMNDKQRKDDYQKVIVGKKSPSKGSLASCVAYQRAILPKVSRTFALTIPELPEPLCTIVGNAYLLCRIADTIEDDMALSLPDKQQLQVLFIAAVKDPQKVNYFVNSCLQVFSEQTSADDRDLVANTEKVIRITHSFTKRQQQIILKHLAIMCQGMNYFSSKVSLYGLRDLDELDCYCYAVAGVVGELLAELFIDHLKLSNQYRETLKWLGASFGQALQMTNILKDIYEDRERGACWLPREMFWRSGVDLARLKTPNKDFVFILQELVGVAHAHCQYALQFIMHIPSSEVGIRRFCLWALGLAFETLLLINKNPTFSSGQEVKVSRRTVKRVILKTNLITRFDFMLKRWGEKYERKLPYRDISPEWEPETFQDIITAA